MKTLLPPHSNRGHRASPRRAVPTLALALACAAFGALAGCAGTPSRDAPPAEVVQPAQPMVDLGHAPRTPPRPYVFAIGDEFDLRVPDAPQFDLSLRVRPDGYVGIPVVGDVYLPGRTVPEVEKEIADKLNRVAGAEGQREYLLHPNDELDLKFTTDPRLNEVVRVRPDGKIQLQLVGTIQAEGVSPEALQATLRSRYARYLRQPDVAVIVRTFSSLTVRTANGAGRAGLRDLHPTIILRTYYPPQIFVSGEVPKPGPMPYRPGLSLVQALAEAGGQMPSGDPSQMLVLRRAANDSVEVLHPGFDRDRLRVPDRDLLLQPYDVVVLPKSSVATLADTLNQYVYNLVPFLRNSSLGISYNIHGYKP